MSQMFGITGAPLCFQFQAAELRQSRPENTLTTSGLSESQGTNNFDLSQDGTSKLKGGGLN